MNTKTIEEKANELFLKRHELTEEEFKENETFLKSTFGYQHCVLYFNLLEVAKALAKMFETAWNGFKYLALKIANIQENNEKKKVSRSKWVVERDTRVKSQVIDNKPRCLIKKIIH